jgi:competence ComEA-like helix-hairpin-helix protein
MKLRKLVISMLGAGVAVALLSFTPTTAMAAGMQSKSMHASGQMAQKSKVNINRATWQQLETVGISPIVARNIVGYRQMHGAYKNTKDLLKVQGVTHKLLTRIEGKITVSNGSR